jgi:hypothetical protein
MSHSHPCSFLFITYMLMACIEDSTTTLHSSAFAGQQACAVGLVKAATGRAETGAQPFAASNTGRRAGHKAAALASVVTGIGAGQGGSTGFCCTWHWHGVTDLGFCRVGAGFFCDWHWRGVTGLGGTRRQRSFVFALAHTKNI